MDKSGLKSGCVSSLLTIFLILFLINLAIEKVSAFINQAKNDIANTTISDVIDKTGELLDGAANVITQITGFNGWTILFAIFFIMVASKLLSKKV